MAYESWSARQNNDRSSGGPIRGPRSWSIVATPATDPRDRGNPGPAFRWLPRKAVVDNPLIVKSDKYLVVLPPVTVSSDALEKQLANGMVEAMVTDLAKLTGLSVMAHASLLNLDKNPIDLDALARNFGVTHVLRGSLEYQDDQVRMNVQLVEIENGTTVWADRFDSAPDNLLALQDVFTERIVDALAVQLSPEERSTLRRRPAGNLESLALYRHGLVLIMPPNDLDRVISARHIFQRVIDIDPEFGGGYAGKSFSHTVTALFLKTSNPREELAQGIELALQAIEVEPEFGMGYVTLAFAYALSGRNSEALSNARRAISLQPGDAFTQFMYGLCLVLSGQPQPAVGAFTEALRLDPAEPRTPYRNLMGVAYLVARDFDAAVGMFEENRLLRGPVGPHIDAFMALALAELGQGDEARSIVGELTEGSPDFPVEKWLGVWIRDAGTHQKAMEILYHHGLPR